MIIPVLVVLVPVELVPPPRPPPVLDPEPPPVVHSTIVIQPPPVHTMSPLYSPSLHASPGP